MLVEIAADQSGRYLFQRCATALQPTAELADRAFIGLAGMSVPEPPVEEFFPGKAGVIAGI